MADELNGKKIAILAADGVEEIEYQKPKQAVEDAGATTELVSLESGEIQAMNHDIEPASKISVDKVVADVSPDDYDGLIIPGGTVNPDKLRLDSDAVSFLQEYSRAGSRPALSVTGLRSSLKRISCAAGTLTAHPSIRTDLRNAGGTVADEEVVVYHAVVTSRSPDDLPAFCAKIVEEFAEGTHEVAEAGATAA